MPFKQLIKSSYLYKTDLRAIKTLVDRCFQEDGFRIKLYWNILQNRQTQELNDILYFIEGNLVGYLAIFTFEADEAEVSVVVHPKYRRLGIYKKLIAEARLELTQRRISKCLCICPQGSFINKTYLQSFHPEDVLSQKEMSTTDIPHFPALPEVQLRLAQTADLPLLVEIGKIGFKVVLNDFQRFSENMREKNRKIWLLSIPEAENIGKVHVRYDENNTAFIHDVVVLPAYRGKKYALAMMVKIMQMLRQQAQKFFTLDVESDNENAIKLYIRCGFKEISTYDFLRISLS